jgi:hypothetical protein
MQTMCLYVLTAVLCGLVPAPQPKATNAQVDAATAQLGLLDQAVQTYFLKHDKFPEKLKTLVDGKIVESKSIVDPWGKEYQYEVGGKRNGGRKPDIWTVTPDKNMIGNWPEEKK